MSNWLRLLACALLSALLAACGTTGKQRGGGGGYYLDDGPGSDIPPDIASIPDAVPRIEAYARANLRPYYVMGQSFTPISDSRPFRQEGVASWYGRKFHGQRTANGERYDMYAMSAAHPTLPLPSYARVTRLDNGKSVVVRINDRGPFLHSRIIDLSYAAAAKLGFVNHGSTRVRVEAITHDEIRRAEREGATVMANRGDSAPAFASAASDTPRASLNDDHDLSDTQTLPVVATADMRPGVIPAAASPAEGLTQIYLQFGAFSAVDSANGLAERINSQIRPIETRAAHVQQANGLHRVRIGPYPNRTDAVNAALRIQEHTGRQATIALQ